MNIVLGPQHIQEQSIQMKAAVCSQNSAYRGLSSGSSPCIGVAYSRKWFTLWDMLRPKLAPPDEWDIRLIGPHGSLKGLLRLQSRLDRRNKIIFLASFLITSYLIPRKPIFKHASGLCLQSKNPDKGFPPIGRIRPYKSLWHNKHVNIDKGAETNKINETWNLQKKLFKKIKTHPLQKLYEK